MTAVQTHNWREDIREYDVNAREWARLFGPGCATDCCYNEVKKRVAAQKENRALKEQILCLEDQLKRCQCCLPATFCPAWYN